MKNKQRRDFEKLLEDEKHAIEADMQVNIHKLKKFQIKNENLQR